MIYRGLYQIIALALQLNNHVIRVIYNIYVIISAAIHFVGTSTTIQHIPAFPTI